MKYERILRNSYRAPRYILLIVSKKKPFHTLYETQTLILVTEIFNKNRRLTHHTEKCNEISVTIRLTSPSQPEKAISFVLSHRLSLDISSDCRSPHGSSNPTSITY